MSERSQNALRYSTPDFEEVAALIGEKQGVTAAIQDPRVDAVVRDLLKIFAIESDGSATNGWC